MDYLFISLFPSSPLFGLYTVEHHQVGTQYRSGIYYTTEEQKKVAEESKKNAKDQFGKDTVVEIVNGEDIPFYLAESYHQRYLEKGGQSAEKGATETIRCYG